MATCTASTGTSIEQRPAFAQRAGKAQSRAIPLIASPARWSPSFCRGGGVLWHTEAITAATDADERTEGIG